MISKDESPPEKVTSPGAKSENYGYMDFDGDNFSHEEIEPQNEATKQVEISP